jgi:hypothetical protein
MISLSSAVANLKRWKRSGIYIRSGFEIKWAH